MDQSKFRSTNFLSSLPHPVLADKASRWFYVFLLPAGGQDLSAPAGASSWQQVTHWSFAPALRSLSLEQKEIAYVHQAHGRAEAMRLALPWERCGVHLLFVASPAQARHGWATRQGDRGGPLRRVG